MGVTPSNDSAVWLSGTFGVSYNSVWTGQALTGTRSAVIGNVGQRMTVDPNGGAGVGAVFRAVPFLDTRRFSTTLQERGWLLSLNHLLLRRNLDRREICPDEGNMSMEWFSNASVFRNRIL